MIKLPVDELIPRVLASLRERPTLVLEAPPGAGKTTRVPPALLELPGEVLVLEPRRLATRLAARRVAEERGERLGGVVGYQVRFEDVSSAATRLRFLTEGLLLRRLLGDPQLRGVGTVVLDEFHERHLATDLTLALLRRLQLTTRPDLRLVVMSATLEAAPVAKFLDAPSLRSEGRRFPVDLEYLPQPDERPLAAQVATAVRSLVKRGLDGDVLVFLPGSAEIEKARAALQGVGPEVVRLHGDMPADEQDRAVSPGTRPKIILSTNVAESSVTVPGVIAVVDSGLARVASHAPWSGLPVLKVARISQASAAQRAGRAGRLRPGRCLRLYTRHDHDTRPHHDLPEVRRMDLAEAALTLHAAGIASLDGFGWFEAPEPAAAQAADALLRRLGAIDDAGAVTRTGERMLRFPLHPRLGRMLVEAELRGCVDEAAIVAASLGERDLTSRDTRRPSGPSDLEELVERPPPGGERARKQLARLAQNRGGKNADSLGLAVLAGFPDRVGRRRAPRSNEILLSAGGHAELAQTSVVRDAELLVAVDIEERRTGTSRKVEIRAASAIEPEWLLELFPDALREEREAVLTGERVEIIARLRYDAITLEERRVAPAPEDGERVGRLLLDAARGSVDREGLERFTARVAFVARTFPEQAIALPDVEAALLAMCAGATSVAEVRGRSLVEELRAAMPAEHTRLVANMAPDRVTLPGGRSVKVEYEAAQTPWISSRLQDFFGLAEGPTIAGGRVPLVLHLLAPNQRAVQVTTDLAGFWVRHYPAIRKELMRKYPRHLWPEDGRWAAPPAKR
jgi:ATP-dependent helicase HrpB